MQNFCSYPILIKPQKESAGKKTAKDNKKMGNVYLKWAFGETSLLLIRERSEIKELHKKLKNNHGKTRALSIIAHKLYYMLKNKQAFDMNKFLH